MQSPAGPEVSSASIGDGKMDVKCGCLRISWNPQGLCGTLLFLTGNHGGMSLPTRIWLHGCWCLAEDLVYLLRQVAHEVGQGFREAVGQPTALGRYIRAWRNWLLPHANKVRQKIHDDMSELQQYLTLCQPSECKSACSFFHPPNLMQSSLVANPNPESYREGNSGSWYNTKSPQHPILNNHKTLSHEKALKMNTE